MIKTIQFRRHSNACVSALSTSGRPAALAAANAVAVAMLYLNQAIVQEVRVSFPDSQLLTLVPMASLAGYAVGVTLIAFGPALDDRFSIERHLGFLALGLGLAASSPDVGVLAFSSFLIGMGAAVAQRLLATAAQIAKPSEAGAAIGRVVGCALVAVLGVKLFGTALAHAVGWRHVYCLAMAAVMTADLFSMLSRPLKMAPAHRPVSDTIAALWSTFPLLRRATLQQAALFAAFNAGWMIALVQVQPSERVVVMIGACFAGLFGARMAGRFSNRRGNGSIAVTGAVAMVLASVLLLPIAYSLPLGQLRTALLLLGMGLIDGGLQVALVINQASVQALRPTMRSRLAATLTICGSLGGAVGAGASYWLWTDFGWPIALGFTAVAACLGVGCSTLPVAQLSPAV